MFNNSPEKSGQLRSKERLKSANYRAPAALAGMVLALSGCTVGNAEPTPNYPSPTFEMPPDDPLLTFSSEYGACDYVTAYAIDDESYIDAQAEDCIDSYEDAEIAFVNYVVTEEDAEALADTTEEHLAYATDGMIDAEITVVEASDEAIELFDLQNIDGCVDISDMNRYGSFIAAATMPELEGYDKVVGITNDPACQPGVAGVANPWYNRYSEVFTVADQLQAAKDNGGKYVIVEETGSMTMTTSLSNPSLSAAHEILHGYSLGHSGDIYGNSASIASPNAGPVDLAALIADSRYQEYERANVMGTPSESSEALPITLPQRYLLEWPYRQLDEETTVDAVEITANPIVLNSIDQVDTLAMLEFETPLETPRSDSEASTISEQDEFTSISFAPSTRDGRIYGVEAYLIGKQQTVVGLGLIYQYGSYQIVADGKTIGIEVSEGTISIVAQ